MGKYVQMIKCFVSLSNCIKNAHVCNSQSHDNHAHTSTSYVALSRFTVAPFGPMTRPTCRVTHNNFCVNFVTKIIFCLNDFCLSPYVAICTCYYVYFLFGAGEKPNTFIMIADVGVSVVADVGVSVGVAGWGSWLLKHAIATRETPY